jgi:plastocyanin
MSVNRSLNARRDRARRGEQSDDPRLELAVAVDARSNPSRTAELRPSGEQSFIMTRPGTTGIHCAIHPNMTGSLIVRAQ